MANKSIKELPKATQIQEDDALPMQQGPTTKQVTGLTLTLWLLDMADGHGGVTDFQKLSESGLEKTYQFTMADTTKYTFTVTDGNGVADFQHSVSGLVHTYKLIMDNGQEYTMTIKDGEKGDKGDNAYFWFKFASEQPTSSSSSMGDEPDAWMGVHSGHEATAPTDPMEYTWVRVLGNQGPTGAPATLIRSAVEYQVSTSGTVEPSGNWSESIPVVPQGNYLWTRTTIQFNTGGIIQSYTNGRNGLDGLGSVVSVNNVSPGENGNVELTADDVGAVPKSGGTMEGPLHMNGQVLDGLNDPTEPDEAVRKAYADKKLALEGGTMEGPIHMNGHLLDGLNDPTEDTEAARKSYVDKSVRASSPYNLLDNSDFTNPVNQRGITSGSLATTDSFCIDRWKRTAADGTSFALQDDGIKISSTGNGGIRQILPTNAKPEQVLTAAVKLSTGEIISGHAEIGEITEATSTFIAASSGAVSLNIQKRILSGVPVIVFNILVNITSATIEWAALYKGAYNAGSIPEYRYKGYASELVACRRYFRRINYPENNQAIFFAFARNSTSLVYLLDVSGMRLEHPTVIISGTFNALMGSDTISDIQIAESSQYEGLSRLTARVDNCVSGAAYMIVTTKTESYIDISADL